MKLKKILAIFNISIILLGVTGFTIWGIGMATGLWWAGIVTAGGAILFTFVLFWSVRQFIK